MSDTAQEQRKPTIIQFPTELDFAEIRDTEAVNAYQADDDGMAALGTLDNLVELSAYGSFTDEGLQALSGLTHLETINLQSRTLTGAGILALAERHPQLRSLSVGLGPTSPGELRKISSAFPALVNLSLSTPSLSIEHLAAFASLPELESLSIWGGGDFLGGDDQAADPLTALEMLKRLPALKTITAKWSNGASMISDHAIIAMMKKRPGLTVNGTWFEPSVFDGSNGGLAPTPVPGDGSLLELTTDSFDEVLSQCSVAIVEFHTTSPNICKRNTFAGEAFANKMSEMAPVLKGRVAVAKVDVHEQPELGERFNVFGAPDLLVFRHGERVGTIGAFKSGSIMIQLQPLLNP